MRSAIWKLRPCTTYLACCSSRGDIAYLTLVFKLLNLLFKLPYLDVVDS